MRKQIRKAAGKIKKEQNPLNQFFALLPEVPLVKAYDTRKEWKTAITFILEKYFAGNAVSAAKLFLLLTTPQERADFMMRVVVLDRLIRGVSYRKINYETGVSVQTISAVKKVAEKANYSSYYERSKTDRKKKVRYVGTSSPSGRDKLKNPHKTKYGTVYW